MLKEVDTKITHMDSRMKEIEFRNTILSTLQEASIDGILVVDENGRIISFNSRFIDMWNIPPEVVESKSDEHALKSVFENLVDPQQFFKKVKYLYENKHEVSRDEISLKDGRTFDRYSAPMFGADSRYYGRVWFFRDMTERKQLENMIQEMSAGLQEIVSKRTLELSKANRDLQEEITERKKAEANLHRSEELRKAVFDSAKDLIFIKDMNRRYVLANNYFGKRFDIDFDAFMGKTDAEIPIFEDKQATAVIIEDTDGKVLRGETVEYELTHQICGEKITFDIIKTPIYDGTGNVTSICGLSRDVTERKKSMQEIKNKNEELHAAYQQLASYGRELEEKYKELEKSKNELQKSGDSYRQLYESMMDAYCKVDMSGRFIEFNTAFREMLGYTEEELLRMSYIDITPVKWREIEERIVQNQIIPRGYSDIYEKEYLRKDGNVLSVELRASLIPDERREPVAMWAIVRNITYRKQAEVTIRDSEEKFSKAFQKAPLLMTISSIKDGTYIDVNEEFAEISGFKREEAIGKTSVELGWLKPTDRELLIETLQSNGSVDGMELELEAKDKRKVCCLFYGEVISIGGQQRLLSIAQDITMHKHAEAALRESELFLKESHRIARLGGWKANPHSDYLEWTEGVYDIIGESLDYKPSLSEGLKYFLPEYIPEIREKVANCLITGDPFTMECEATSTTGQHLWTEVKGLAPIVGGERSYVIGTFQDITDRKHAEETLRLQALVLDQIQDRVTVTDLSGVISFVNQSELSSLGYSREELIGRSISVYGEDPEKGAVQQEILNKTIENGSWRGVVANYSADGREIIMDCRTQVVHDNHGKPIALAGIATDVTESKRLERELEENRINLNTVFNATDDIILLTDMNGKVLLYNQIVAKRFQHISKNLAGYNIFDLVPEDCRILRRQYFDDSLQSATPIMFEDVTMNRTWSNTVYPVIGQDGSVSRMVLFGRDITDRKQAEIERKFMEKQLFQAQKMEAIGTMSGGIAHDFNNILGIIIGYTEMAMNENKKEKQNQYLQKTLEGADRAKEIIKQLLTFSRKDIHENKPMDLKFLIKEAVKFIRASIPATIEICQHLTVDSCNILADPTQIHQIIMNLCSNATHAMKRTGGILKIELSNVEIAQGDLPIDQDLKPGHYAKLTVSDTGHGIDPDLQQRIFDPFFTTKSQEEGTGLGLSVVYGIVKAHNGIINVHSQTDKGATFNIYLPLIVHAEIMKMETGIHITGGTERILFVDDEPGLVDLGKRMLSSLGYEVAGVTSSVEALQLFLTEPQRFDLVITDMTLPKMTGIVLSRKILKIRPDIPIILCSGVRERETEEKVKSLGIRAYLTKPLAIKELSRVIRDTLNGHEKHIS